MRKVPLRKKGGQWYVRMRRGGMDTMYPTGSSVRRQAEALGDGIVAMFDREKTAKRLASDLMRYAYSIARDQLSMAEVRGPLQALERVAAMEALDAMEALSSTAGVTADIAWRRYETAGAVSVKASTLDTRRKRWAVFSRWAKSRDLKSMTQADARAYLDSLKCSGQTWNNAVTDLGIVFRGAGLDDVWAGLRRKAVEHAEKPLLDMDMLRMLLEWMDSHAREKVNGIPLSDWSDYTRCLYYSGLRPSDVCGLRASDISGGRVELVPEKTSRTRKKVSYVADPSLLSILERRGVDGAGCYFPEHYALYRRDRTAFQHCIRRMLRYAGLPEGGLTWYQLRSNFVTQQVRSGEDIEDVAAAVGHVSESTTKEHYYHGKIGVELSRMPII